MKNFLFVAQFLDNAGYAVAARGWLKALDAFLRENPDAFGLKVFVIPLETQNSKVTDAERKLVAQYELKADDIVSYAKKNYDIIWLMPPPMISWKDRSDLPLWQQIKMLFAASQDNINMSFWEATAIPNDWIEVFKLLKTKKVIVACKWNKSVYEEALIRVCDVGLVPCVVDPVECSNIAKISTLEPFLKGRYVFLSVAQWQPRKGLNDLLRAYYAEFGHRQDVLLILKTYINIMNGYSASNQQQHVRIVNEIKAIREQIFLEDGSHPTAQVIVVPGAIPRENLNWLYSVCNSFVLPTRGEGFCYPLAEAMQFGKPVLVSAKGGHLDLVDNYSMAWLTGGTWEQYEGLAGYHCNMNWYRADINFLRENMAFFAQHKGEYSAGVFNGAAYSPIEVGKRLAKELLNV